MKDGWSKLKKKIQYEGYKQGVELVCASTTKKFYVIRCKRSLKCRHSKLDKTNIKEKIENEDNQFSSFAKGQFYRRRRVNESTKHRKQINYNPFVGPRRPSKYHTYTNRSTSVEKLCSFRFTIHKCLERNIFYIKSGLGTVYH